jgi:hypothetical protein
LKAVAKDLHVRDGCLRHHFPVLSQEIVKNFALRSEKEALQKKLRIQAAVRKHFSKILLSKRISRKGALRSIGKATGLPKEPLRKAINKFVDELVAS